MKKTDYSDAEKIVLTKGKDVILIRRSGPSSWKIADDVSVISLTDSKMSDYVDFYKKTGYKVTINKTPLKTKLKNKTGKIKSQLEAVTKKRRGYTVPAATQVYWVKKGKK